MAKNYCQQDPEDIQRKRDREALDAHANQLTEQFDSIVIIATRHMGANNGTVFCSGGAGNWYSRYGSVRAWLVNEDTNMGE